MSFDKISVTLYDILGYLLPGFVLLMGGVVAEATFVKTHLLTLAGINANPLPYIVFAYFLGQFCHATGAFLKEWCRTRAKRCNSIIATLPPQSLYARILRRCKRVLEPYENGLNDELEKEVEIELCAAYKVRPEQLEQNKGLTLYLLADHFVLALGGITEREIYQAREGFFKASTVAFLCLGVLFFASIFVGGAKVNHTKDLTETMTWSLSAWLCFFCVCASTISWRRHFFFSCLKKNHVKLLFLAIRRTKEGVVPTSPSSPSATNP